MYKFLILSLLLTGCASSIPIKEAYSKCEEKNITNIDNEYSTKEFNSICRNIVRYSNKTYPR